MQTLEFRLNRDEFGAAVGLIVKHGYRHVFEASPSTRMLFLIRTYFPLVLLLLLAVTHEFRHEYDFLLLPFVVLCFSYVALFMWLKKRNYLIRWFALEDGMHLRTHRIVVRDDSLQVVSNMTKSEMSWSCIKDVEDLSGMILLYTDAADALIVPRRAFALHEDAESFLAMMRSKISAEATSMKSI